LSKKIIADPSRRRPAADARFALHVLKTIGDFVASFRRSHAAAAAIEFALVLPLALIIYVGAAEVEDAVVTDRKVVDVTRTLVDLLSRQPTSFQAASTPVPAQAVSQTTLSSMFAAAQTLLYPEPTATLQMTLSAVDVVNDPSDGTCCIATVRWSFTQGGTLRPCKNLILENVQNPQPDDFSKGAIPNVSTLQQPVAYLIADVSYVYQPVLGQSLFTWAPAMAHTIYMMPRSTGQVIADPSIQDGSQTGKICY
jgi:Flp pilus assembly protein TadG